MLINPGKNLFSGEVNGYNIPEVTPAPEVSRLFTEEGIDFLESCRGQSSKVDNAVAEQAADIGWPTGNGKKLSCTHPSILPGPAVPGCTLVSFRFL